MSSASKLSGLEGVAVISCDGHPPEHLIQKILNVDVLPTAFVSDSGISGYEWKIETKYYSAVVNLYAVQDRNKLNSEFCNSIRAVVFYFNGKEPASFENVSTWMPSLESMKSDVQLIVCDSCGSEEVNKKNILNWCVEKEFELIELNAESDESDNEEESTFSGAKGYSRVIEALQSHTWSNLIMKKSTKAQSDDIKGENEVKSNENASSSAASQKAGDNSRKMKVENDELLLEEQWLQKILEQDDPDGESFEALFSKFASMKEKASGLNGEERKKYAEKVAIAFWRAMGGEEDEIEGLDE